jgi:hypothetical protein
MAAWTPVAFGAERLATMALRTTAIKRRLVVAP